MKILLYLCTLTLFLGTTTIIQAQIQEEELKNNACMFIK